ncbi:MAG: hypothetical protein EAZ07_02700 [Cytophagales bacterium]|nr:MAG: hypothetical protein EAZ07_02700 [Cytophagales bacterium]
MKTTTPALIIICCLLPLLQIGCNEKLPESKAIAAENKKRKIGKIEQAQIIDEALRLGTLIAFTVDSTWQANLTNEINNKTNFKNSVACNIRNYMFSKNNLNKIKVNKWGNSITSSISANNKEKQIWEALQYNTSHNTTTEASIQKSGDSLLFYIQPILTTNTCKSCHANFQEKQIVGMWSIQLAKKQVVENIWLNK